MTTAATMSRDAPTPLPEPAGNADLVEFVGLSIDTAVREVIVDRRVVELTKLEFDLLAHLAAAPRRVFSRRELLCDVWHSSPDWQTSKTVTEHVRRIRGKIESDPGRPHWIRTVAGVGYRFEPRSNEALSRVGDPGPHGM